MHGWLAKYLHASGEKVLSQIPLVKTVYSALKDLTKFAAQKNEDKEHKSAVLITIDGKQLIGVVTRDSLASLEDLHPHLLESPEESLCVYIPMSYQLGGFTLIVPRKGVTPISMPIEQALRFSVTAGMTTSSNINE
jgi:uncharacterized membrane protein